MEGISFKAIFAVLLLGIALLGLWIVERVRDDEEINPEIVAYVQNIVKYQKGIKYHPDFILLGMDAKRDQDQNVLARMRYAANQLSHENYDYKPILERVFQVEMQLKRQDIQQQASNLKSLVGISDRSAWDYELLENNKAKIVELISQEAHLLQRYQQYLDQTQAKPLYHHAYSFGVDKTSILGYSNQLYLLNVWFSANSDEQKLTALASYFLNLENLLAHDKVGAEESVIVDNMHLSLEMMHILNQQLQHSLQLKLLTKAQLYHGATADHMFAGLYFGLLSIPEGEDRPLFLYQKETLNKMYEVVKWGKQTASQSYREYAQQNWQTLMKPQEQASSLNVDGDRYVKMMYVIIGTHQIHKHLLNSKIQVFNTLSQNKNYDLAVLNQNKEGYEYFERKSKYSGDKLCIKNPHNSNNGDIGLSYKEESCLSVH